MSGRSSLLSAIALLAACGGSKKVPEADPAKLAPIWKQMVVSFPGPGMRECAGKDVVGGATMTATTFFALSGAPFTATKPEYQEYVNPAKELDSPAAHTLADPKASTLDKRRAAAELLAAPFYLVYHVDLVSVPMALEVKELKRGTVSGRAIRFDKQGSAVCVRVFNFQQDKAISDAAIAKSNKATIDPAVAAELRADLRVQMLKRIQVLTLPQAPMDEMQQKPPDNMGG
jgi:hypothetical protein